MSTETTRTRGCAAGRGPRAAPARRTRPAGTPATPRAGSGTSGTWPPRRAGRPPAGAAATAVCAGRAGGAAAAAPARRTRGTGTRTAPSAGGWRRPAPRCLPGRSSRRPSAARRPPPATAARCRRRPTSTRPACRSCSPRRRSMAIAHGAWTGVPNGLSTQMRQSPISSRKRSTTIVRSSGTTPVASACSSRYCSRFDAASASRAYSSRSTVGGLGRRQLAQLADERAERPAQLERAARAVAVPERHLPRLARRRRDGDLLERDVLDPPRRRAEHERLAGPALVDHLLVELADPRAVGEEHAEQPTVGDRAAGRDGQPLRPVAGPHRVGRPGSTRPAAAARRTPRSGSVRPAGRGCWRTARRTARRSWPSDARARRARRRRSRRAPTVWATICWASTSSGLRR